MKKIWHFLTFPLHWYWQHESWRAALYYYSLGVGGLQLARRPDDPKELYVFTENIPFTVTVWDAHERREVTIQCYFDPTRNRDVFRQVREKSSHRQIEITEYDVTVNVWSLT